MDIPLHDIENDIEILDTKLRKKEGKWAIRPVDCIYLNINIERGNGERTDVVKTIIDRKAFEEILKVINYEGYEFVFLDEDFD